jgi:hypothetical protein
MKLGCIADDFTGATDLANNLVRAGLRVVQLNGVPERRAAGGYECRRRRRPQVAHHRPGRRGSGRSRPAASRVGGATRSTSRSARHLTRRRAATSAVLGH